MKIILIRTTYKHIKFVSSDIYLLVVDVELLFLYFTLSILLVIVWWTMFAGRDKGELKSEKPSDPEQNRPPKE